LEKGEKGQKNVSSDLTVDFHCPSEVGQKGKGIGNTFPAKIACHPF
jgi:hypothetical protein